MSKKYAVIGASSIDIFAISKFFKPDEVSIENNITFSQGSHIWLDNSIHEPGGNGLLAATTLARQDNHVDLYTKLSSDLFGKALQTVAKEEGITLSDDSISAKHHTDTVLHLSSNGKDHTQMIYSESFADISKKTISNINPKIDSLHLANNPNSKSVLNTILRWCKKNDVKLSVNLQYINKLSTGYLIKFFKQCSIVVLNHDEACMLLGGYCPILEIANKLSDLGLMHFVIFGETAESVACCDKNYYSAKLKIKSKTLEYTGAEAVFAAAYVEEFNKSNDSQKAITRAVTQASSIMTVSGARAGILYNPIRKEMSVKTHLPNLSEETL